MGSNDSRLTVKPLVDAYFAWAKQNLLTEIPKHMDDYDASFCEDLLHLADELPKECKEQL